MAAVAALIMSQCQPGSWRRTLDLAAEMCETYYGKCEPARQADFIRLVVTPLEAR